MEAKSIVTAYNKSHKTDAFQLPKISRTVLMQSHLAPFDINRYQWLTYDHNYAEMTHKEIEQEYRLLRKELLAVNDTAARSLQMLKTQTSTKKKRANSSDYHNQVMGQEIQNNKQISARLREELERLLARQKQLEANGKRGIEELIEETKDSIERMKQEIKEINGKSRQLNNSWDRETKIEQEIKRLEVERQIVDRKRQKLELKSREVKQNNEKLVNQLAFINEDSSKAEEMIEEELEIRKERDEESEMEGISRYRMYQVEALQKNIQSITNAKTIKYHQVLKKMEDIASRQTRCEQRINETQQKIIISKQEIARYQQHLNEAKAAQQANQEYEEILKQSENASQPNEEGETQNRISKKAQYSVQNKQKISSLAKISLGKKEKEQNIKGSRSSANKTRTIDFTVESYSNKERQSASEEVLIGKVTQNLRIKHKPEILKSNSKKKQSEPKDSEFNQVGKGKQEQNLKGVYEKLKTWNEQASIDEVQGNQNISKKIVNRMLVNVKEADKSQKAIQLIQKDGKKQRTSLKNVQQQKKSQLKDEGDEAKSLNEIDNKKENKADKKYLKRVEQDKAGTHKQDQDPQQAKPNEKKTKEQKLAETKPQQTNQPKAGAEEIRDEYIEQFEKKVEKEKENIGKGVKVLISLNDLQSSLSRQKPPPRKANKYDSIEQQILNQQQQIPQ